MQRRRRYASHVTAWSSGLPSTESGAPDMMPADPLAVPQDGSEVQSEFFQAAQIQRKLGGPRSLRRGDLQLASEVFAARYLSGDFTVVWDYGDSVICGVGDIAGKGLAAGMWFTYLVGLLQRHTSLGATPAEVAAELNRNLCCLRPSAPFVTLFLLRLDVAASSFEYCNAGHFPPLLLRPSGCAELSVGGPLLGALPAAEYAQASVELAAGERLVAYSDGVIECRNHADEEFGVERLARAAGSITSSAFAAVMSLLGTLQDFADGSPLSDDVSLMILQRDEAGAL